MLFCGWVALVASTSVGDGYSCVGGINGVIGGNGWW